MPDTASESAIDTGPDIDLSRAFWYILAGVIVLYALGLNDHWRFQRDGPYFFGLARSMLEDGSYEFNYRPHTKYSPGFPAMLAGIGYFYGLPDTVADSFLPFNLLVSLFGIGSICLFYLILRELRSPPWLAFWALLFFAAARALYYYSAHILTDVPFTFFALAALLAMLKMRHAGGRVASWAWCVVTGLLAAVASIIRPVGPLLVVAVAAGLWAHRDALRHWLQRAGQTLLITIFVAAPIVWWSRVTRRMATEGKHYFRNKVGSSAVYNVLASPFTRFIEHTEGLSEALCGTKTGTIAGTLILIAMLTGLFIWMYRGERELSTFTVLCFGAVVGGGWTLDDRYLLPGLAVVFYWTVLGTVAIGRYLGAKTDFWTKRRLRIGGYVLCAMLLTINFIRIGKIVYKNRHPDFYEVVDHGRVAAYRPVLRWLRQNAERDDVIIGYEFSTLYYFTRLHGAPLPRYARNVESGWLRRQVIETDADYLVRDAILGSTLPIIDEFRSRHPEALDKIMASGQVTLFRINRDRLRAGSGSDGEV